MWLWSGKAAFEGSLGQRRAAGDQAAGQDGLEH